MDKLILVTLAEAYALHTGRSEATISNRVTSHARFFERLRAGKDCNTGTFNAVFKWFDDHWPDDLEWPSDIPRPSEKGSAA